MNAVSESHPLSPFLPPQARCLFLGSFPPPKKRWSMEFFYPNWTNDSRRIWGLIAKGDKEYFAVAGAKRFDKERIEAFCWEAGIALYDTAEEVVRLRNNASDNFLQVVLPTDLAALLGKIPGCHTIVGCAPLGVGECCEADFAGRRLRIWRMPSTSRAFPRSIEWKAAFYRKLLDTL